MSLSPNSSEGDSLPHPDLLDLEAGSSESFPSEEEFEEQLRHAEQALHSVEEALDSSAPLSREMRSRISGLLAQSVEAVATMYEAQVKIKKIAKETATKSISTIEKANDRIEKAILRGRKADDALREALVLIRKAKEEKWQARFHGLMMGFCIGLVTMFLILLFV